MRPTPLSPPPTADELFPSHFVRPTETVPPVVENPSRPAVTHFTILPWPDPVIDRVGMDPRSSYVEQFWLGIVGPASVLLVRHLASRFDEEADGFVLDLTHTARILGLGTGLGRWGPVQRTVHRCVGFGFAQRWGEDRLLVRRKLPPATRAQLTRLPEDRQADHDRWRNAALHGVVGLPGRG